VPKQAATYNVQLAMAYLSKGDLALAREKIEKALKQDPTNVDAHRAAALLYDRLGDNNRADKEYSTVLRLKPGDPEALNNYGVYLCRHERIDEGEKLFLKAARDPVYKTPESAYTNAGLCMRGAKRYDEAIKYFETALTAKPRYGDALYQMADVNFEQKRLPEAQLYVQRYIQNVGASAEILWLGVRVERALGNPHIADSYAKRLKAEYPATEQTRALLASERKPG
jgi:type IV pilus assembly protein PilF